ncbi:multifunctional methyltransferase subunit TRM112-like protein [Branchiostoma floridae]|uniref:Multifunctional methyltransferase subunit TRM112-like protein n=2 Tax=Branchiostoma floridae TaxID=7739 RepID=A0A9J7MZE3_BRAFL|nr:multifunctional methyltransferase subunit TRM112-like protein [Branchiostoma floridae]
MHRATTTGERLYFRVAKNVGCMLLSFRTTMRLLTHNMLTSHVKGVTNGYPLKLQAENIKVMSVDFNPEFVARMIPKLEWQALVQAAESIGHLGDLPRELMPEYESNEEFLKMAHHVLMEVEVIEGNLECPETGRKFPIKNGIPNMLLNEDEV